MATIQLTDSDGNTFIMEFASDVTITNVDLNEEITVSASAVPVTGRNPHVESVKFIGPSRAGMPISKK